jgi:hypothetical protein
MRSLQELFLYAPSQDRGGKKRGREKQSATNRTQITKSKEGLTGKDSNRSTRRWREQGRQGSSVLSSEAQFKRGGSKSLKTGKGEVIRREDIL